MGGEETAQAFAGVEEEVLREGVEMPAPAGEPRHGAADVAGGEDQATTGA